MTVKNWQKYLDEIQFSFFSVSLVCLGVFMLLSVSRDFVFSDFQPPTWLLALDLIGIAIFAATFLAASMKWMRPADAKTFLILCFVCVAFRPGIIVQIDGTPATLILCSVIFSTSLLFLTRRLLFAGQFATLLIWVITARQSLLTTPYLVTLAMTFVAAGVAYWLQSTRLSLMRQNFLLANRVEALESLVSKSNASEETDAG